MESESKRKFINDLWCFFLKFLIESGGLPVMGRAAHQTLSSIFRSFSFHFVVFFLLQRWLKAEKKDDFHQPLSSPNLRLLRQLKHLKQKLEYLHWTQFHLEISWPSSIDAHLLWRSHWSSKVFVVLQFASKERRNFLTNKNSLSSRKGFRWEKPEKVFLQLSCCNL